MRNQTEKPAFLEVSTLGTHFYGGDDVVAISRALLGKVLCANINGATTKAFITETEAYAGVSDKASHAYRGRRTKRTEILYMQGGTAYVYLCYGIHHLFNVVTNKEDVPHAVLIRAGMPLEGADRMRKRRGKNGIGMNLIPGPGSLSKALGITTNLTGVSLLGKRVWIEDYNLKVDDQAIHTGPRIGVDYAEEDAKRPYRFVLTQADLTAAISIQYR